MSQGEGMSMGARVGSLAVFVLLIGATQFCQASRVQELAGSRLQDAATKAAVNKLSLIDTRSLKSGSSSDVEDGSAAHNNDNERVDNNVIKEAHYETEKVAIGAVDNSGQKLKGTVRLSGTLEGVSAVDAPSPGPSSAFSLLPSLVTPALAVFMSFAALAAAKAL